MTGLYFIFGFLMFVATAIAAYDLLAERQHRRERERRRSA
jgi:hypothetical protein